MKIFFTGAQGTGKTTILDEIKDHPLIISNRFKVVTSMSRKIQDETGMNLRGGKDTTLLMQQSIFDAYESAFSGSSNILADRSLYDVIAYTKHILQEERQKAKDDPYPNRKEMAQIQSLSSLYKCQCELCRLFEKQYGSDIIYFYFPIEFDIVSDGTRSADPEFQKEIDSTIREMIDGCEVEGVCVYTVRGTVAERVQFINNILNSKMT